VQHFKADAASITLELPGSSSSPYKDRVREGERLSSLSAWLHRNGGSLSKLVIQVPEPLDLVAEYVSGRAQGLSAIISALAASGNSHQYMRLRQLQLPVTADTLPAIVQGALSACQGLRELQLDYSGGGQGAHPASDLQGIPLLALQQLSQLTSLRLTYGRFKQETSMCFNVHLGYFCSQLPSSLEVLAVTLSSWPHPFKFNVAPNSLQHLVALRQLTLPDNTDTFSFATSGDTLVTLTALTSLVYDRALLEGNQALLAAPHLQEIWTHYTPPQGLEALAPLTALRSLVCAVRRADGVHAAALLALTQLTRLGLLVMEGAQQTAAAANVLAQYLNAGYHGYGVVESDDEEPATPVAMWGGAVSALPGLRSLTVEPGLLPRLDLAALTALTELVVRGDWHKHAYPPGRLQQLLGGVGAARGRLQVVKVQGVEGAEQAACRAALAAALGDVTVVFE
jgi:hypothetical protein